MPPTRQIVTIRSREMRRGGPATGRYHPRRLRREDSERDGRAKEKPKLFAMPLEAIF